MRDLVIKCLLAIASAAIVLVASEALLRLLDGYALLKIELSLRSPHHAVPEDTALIGLYAADMWRAEGVDLAWVSGSPQRHKPETSFPDDLMARWREISDPFAAFHFPYVWNRLGLPTLACRYQDTIFRHFPGYALSFDPVDGSPLPRYRHYPNAWLPSGLATNEWGWRGAPVELDKPAGSIRLAFVGASTTVNHHSFPFSYPELVGHWLQLWADAKGIPVTFEVMNTARGGLDPHDLEAVVRTEVMPFEPDLVLYYEGANTFRSIRFLRSEASASEEVPPASPTFGHLREYSALLRRLRQLTPPSVRSRSRRPRMQTSAIAWPAGVDEFAPDPESPHLPLRLPERIHSWNAIRALLAQTDTQLILSSFVFMVSPDLEVDRVTHPQLFEALNVEFSPFSYADLARMVEFQNRVFARYAAAHRLHFIDVAGEFPPDPGLFIDLVHRTMGGVRLHGWIVFNALVPILEAAIDEGNLPRPDRAELSEHPAFTQGIERMPTLCRTRRDAT